MDVVLNSDCYFIPDHSSPISTQGSALLNFLVALNYDPDNPPAAALLKKCNGLEGEWLIVSPMHWQATHNSAHIVATPKELQLSESESRFWFRLYSNYLAEEGMTLYYHDSELWLLCVTNKPALNARPVHHLLNKPFMPELAQLDPTLYWQKFITESQMFFAAQTKSSDINGLWLWGGAQPGEKKSLKICADAEFLPLARTVSFEVTEYSAAVLLKEFQLLLLNDSGVLSESHKHELTKMPVTWYWNNSAYNTKKHKWFIKLWRKLTHAH